MYAMQNIITNDIKIVKVFLDKTIIQRKLNFRLKHFALKKPEQWMINTCK